MRLARTLWNPQRADQILRWLKARGVDAQLQPYPVEQPISWRVWIIEEEKLIAAREWIDRLESGEISLEEALESLPESIPLELPKQVPASVSTTPWTTPLFAWTLLTIQGIISWSPGGKDPSYYSQQLLIDQPQPNAWPGLYRLLLEQLHSHSFPSSWTFLGSIQQGEYWRLVTPALLHANWLHLLLNLLWIITLGRAIEPKLGAGRLLLLITLAAVLSNIAQYTVSGYSFLGSSGVVMALIGFCFLRQRLYPWEGYPIAPSTFTFTALYLTLTLSLQLLSFILEALGIGSIYLGTANTAHLAGLAIGGALGCLRSMSIRTNR